MTTPGNAMDAGPSPRDALLAKLSDLREVCGPQAEFDIPSGFVVLFAEGLAEEVERHHVLTSGVMAGRCAQCPDGGHVEDGVCLFLRRWCRVLGVGGETGDSKQGVASDNPHTRRLPTSATVADFGGEDEDEDPPAAVAASPHAEGEPGCVATPCPTPRAPGFVYCHRHLADPRVPPAASPETPVPGEAPKDDLGPCVRCGMDRAACWEQAPDYCCSRCKHFGPPVPGEGVAG